MESDSSRVLISKKIKAGKQRRTYAFAGLFCPSVSLTWRLPIHLYSPCWPVLLVLPVLSVHPLVVMNVIVVIAGLCKHYIKEPVR
ncbi:MAG: hypothetical protein K0Q73_9078 [Paenibacillus sp.]|nr:hypothetical protein [Paenibacillus sp.]